MLQILIITRDYFLTTQSPIKLYTLSLHDALPISTRSRSRHTRPRRPRSLLPTRSNIGGDRARATIVDRKSTRLNSSHGSISYAVFCLKKKKKKKQSHTYQQ